MIGKNHGRVKFLQLFDERILAINPPEGKVKAAFAKRVFDECRVVRFVFDHQNAKLRLDKLSSCF